jgi:hypothetical protein
MVLLQRAVTPRGITVQAGGLSPRRAAFFMSPKRSIETT